MPQYPNPKWSKKHSSSSSLVHDSQKKINLPIRSFRTTNSLLTLRKSKTQDPVAGLSTSFQVAGRPQ